MANLGGGAEAHAHFKQYEDRANWSPVCTTDSCPYDTHEPTGEPESLYSKINPNSFDDHATRGKPQELVEKIKKSKEVERDPASAEPKSKKDNKRRRIHMRIADKILYKPKTKERLAAYENLLSVMQQQFGGQPKDALAGAADEVLSVLKNEKIKNPDKKKEIEKLVNPITNQLFDQIVSIGRMISDFQDGGGAGGSTIAVNGDDEALDAIGVSVEFEKDEEEEDDDFDQIQEESDEDDEDMKESNGAGGMQMSGIDDDEIEEAKEGFTLNVHDIDTYWLQRKISKAFEEIDLQHSQKLAEDVLKILAEGDDRDVENRLLKLLEYENFDLIKLLLRHRLKIVWCTRLATAEDQNERKNIEEEMSNMGPALSSILEKPHTTRASARERQKNLEKSIREEARRLEDEHGSSIDGERDNRRFVINRDSDNNGWAKGQRQLLDLESIAFQQGGLLMANKKCELPCESYITPHSGYQEVHVPAPKRKPLPQGVELVKITQLPEWAQPAFAGMYQLNRVQSRVYKTAFFTHENILLCAPTGVGKTNVVMLTILHEIALHRNEVGEVDNSKYKIVYVAPMKALVAEIVRILSRRLKHLNINVKELIGDQSLTRHEIEETQIIVTTPEKWDIVARKSEDRTYTQLVKLLIIDEIHLLHDNRGPVLESIVARTVQRIETTKEHIRLVGLSANLPNYEDVALFLHVHPTKGLFHFDNNYRHCPLAQRYIKMTVKEPLQKIQLMNDICYEKVLAGAGKHQTLVFVHSEEETSKTARSIRDTALANDTLRQFLKDDSASHEFIQSQAELVKSNDLKDLLPYGLAIHHAGMNRTDRSLVEDLFADGHIQVLVSTATLARGVNFPAHTVIIKGTQIYNPERGSYTELSHLDVMQMLGRAGRPHYDSYGEGIILTDSGELRYYLSLVNHQLPIESQFISKLADQLNAEIALGTIQNAREARTWVGYTYLYIRMLRNPTLYGIPADVLDKDRTLEERKADLIHSAASILDKNNLIKYDRKSGYFQVTDLGRIASYYNITHGTISTYNEYLKPTTDDIELFRIVSLSEEFKHVPVRQDEKIELAKLIDRVPIPVKESLEEPSVKVNVLLQAYISQLKLEGHSPTSDMVYIRQSAGRLLRALYEIVRKRGWSELAEKALNLCKMVDKHI